MSSTFMGNRDYAPAPVDAFTRNELRANNSNFAFDGVLLSLRIFTPNEWAGFMAAWLEPWENGCVVEARGFDYSVAGWYRFFAFEFQSPTAVMSRVEFASVDLLKFLPESKRALVALHESAELALMDVALVDKPGVASKKAVFGHLGDRCDAAGRVSFNGTSAALASHGSRQKHGTVQRPMRWGR